MAPSVDIKNVTPLREKKTTYRAKDGRYESEKERMITIKK
jgi:hypothetical protein